MIHRARHDKLLDLHTLLIALHTGSGKRPRTEDDAPVPDPATFSQSDYPNIHFWTKDKWTTFELK